jgi:hypothetical protein
MRRKHRDEAAVREALQLTGTKQLKAFANIRKMGNYNVSLLDIKIPIL